jgi:hypothetical protein
MLRPFIVAMMILVAGIASLSAQRAKPKPTGPVMREPFDLRLKVDKAHYEQVHYDKQPYVSDNEVYLFSGEKFGVNLVVKDGRVAEVRYQPDVKKADVVFGFEQPKELQDGLGMTLTIDNKMKRAVGMEGLMTIPGKKDPLKTSILPVKAGKSGLESWPHPIWQLVLGNLRFAPEGATQPKK